MGFDSFDIERAKESIIRILRDFFKKSGSGRAVLGLSGGIDSAVVMALACEALGSENVHGLIMPSPFSTVHSVTDAVDLANNLGAQYSIVPIDKIYNKYIKELSGIINPSKWSVTQENLQARIRGTILMAYSNQHNALLLNTSNKSELCVGYGTLYGDLCGAVMVIGDLYKCHVYRMASLINSQKRVIPDSTMTKAPSAELNPGQKDSDSLPDYSLLDPILYQLTEKGKSGEELINEGADPLLLNRILSLTGRSSFKTLQTPPIIQLTERPLADSSKWIK